MAGAKDVVLSQLQLGQNLFQQFTSDLSDAEYFMAPAGGANHAGWILGHLACSEDWVVSLVNGTDYRIAQTMHDLFRGGTTCLADASRYSSRPEIDGLFREARAFTAEALRAFDEGRWDDSSPDRVPRQFFPTLGSLWGLTGTHQFWHFGQLTVCRQALGKKRLLN